MSAPVRIGVLGCGGVVDYALLDPARSDGAITVAAIASRDGERAHTYAQAKGIARHHGSYEALLTDDTIEAVYVALPNALHHEWTLRALDAGFPVLCEKPLASNAEQAGEMARRADETGRLLMEGFHWRHHPAAVRMLEIVRSGVLGSVRHIEASFTIPAQFVPPTNIRMDYALGGGSTMDQGCYCISLIRAVAGAEPQVESAQASVIAPQIDGAMSAQMRFADGATAAFSSTMIATGDDIVCAASVDGEVGRLTLSYPFLPDRGSHLRWETRDGVQEEYPVRTPTYVYQARNFARAVREGAPSNAWDGVANMRVIDAVYRAAGLEIRR